MCCQRQNEMALMIEGGDGVARKKKKKKKKNSVCVDAQPRALRGRVFLSPLPLSF